MDSIQKRRKMLEIRRRRARSRNKGNGNARLPLSVTHGNQYATPQYHHHHHHPHPVHDFHGDGACLIYPQAQYPPYDLLAQCIQDPVHALPYPIPHHVNQYQAAPSQHHPIYSHNNNYNDGITDIISEEEEDTTSISAASSSSSSSSAGSSSTSASQPYSDSNVSSSSKLKSVTPDSNISSKNSNISPKQEIKSNPLSSPPRHPITNTINSNLVLSKEDRIISMGSSNSHERNPSSNMDKSDAHSSIFLKENENHHGTQVETSAQVFRGILHPQFDNNNNSTKIQKETDTDGDEMLKRLAFDWCVGDGSHDGLDRVKQWENGREQKQVNSDTAKPYTIYVSKENCPSISVFSLPDLRNRHLSPSTATSVSNNNTITQKSVQSAPPTTCLFSHSSSSAFEPTVRKNSIASFISLLSSSDGDHGESCSIVTISTSSSASTSIELGLEMNKEKQTPLIIDADDNNADAIQLSKIEQISITNSKSSRGAKPKNGCLPAYRPPLVKGRSSSSETNLTHSSKSHHQKVHSYPPPSLPKSLHTTSSWSGSYAPYALNRKDSLTSVISESSYVSSDSDSASIYDLKKDDCDNSEEECSIRDIHNMNNNTTIDMIVSESSECESPQLQTQMRMDTLNNNREEPSFDQDQGNLADDESPKQKHVKQPLSPPPVVTISSQSPPIHPQYALKELNSYSTSSPSTNTISLGSPMTCLLKKTCEKPDIHNLNHVKSNINAPTAIRNISATSTVSSLEGELISDYFPPRSGSKKKVITNHPHLETYYKKRRDKVRHPKGSKSLEDFDFLKNDKTKTNKISPFSSDNTKYCKRKHRRHQTLGGYCHHIDALGGDYSFRLYFDKGYHDKSEPTHKTKNHLLSVSASYSNKATNENDQDDKNKPLSEDAYRSLQIILKADKVQSSTTGASCCLKDSIKPDEGEIICLTTKDNENGKNGSPNTKQPFINIPRIIETSNAFQCTLESSFSSLVALPSPSPQSQETEPVVINYSYNFLPQVLQTYVSDDDNDDLRESEHNRLFSALLSFICYNWIALFGCLSLVGVVIILCTSTLPFCHCPQLPVSLSFLDNTDYVSNSNSQLSSSCNITIPRPDPFFVFLPLLVYITTQNILYIFSAVYLHKIALVSTLRFISSMCHMKDNSDNATLLQVHHNNDNDDDIFYFCWGVIGCLWGMAICRKWDLRQFLSHYSKGGARLLTYGVFYYEIGNVSWTIAATLQVYPIMALLPIFGIIFTYFGLQIGTQEEETALYALGMRILPELLLLFGMIVASFQSINVFSYHVTVSTLMFIIMGSILVQAFLFVGKEHATSIV